MFNLNTNSREEFILRIAFAFSFLYPPLSAFLNPYAWIGYFPTFVTSIIPLDTLTLLHLFGALEVLLGIWILFGKNIKLPTLIGSTLLALIVLTNLSQIDVLFRDIPILLIGVVLLLRSYGRA